MARMSKESLSNRLLHGDAVQLMGRIPDNSIDLIVTDPPYLVNYRDRSGRSLANDDPDNANWLEPAFSQMYRVLKRGSLCLSSYGWNRIEPFMSAWKGAGFTPVGHIVWQKHYASSARITKATHECAYLLAKGRPNMPDNPVRDVLPWGRYTGNRLHPCQKPVSVFEPIIEAYSKSGNLILDPFAGSASTAVAAQNLDRYYLAMEMDWTYYQAAWRRLNADI